MPLYILLVFKNMVCNYNARKKLSLQLLLEWKEERKQETLFIQILETWSESLALDGPNTWSGTIHVSIWFVESVEFLPRVVSELEMSEVSKSPVPPCSLLVAFRWVLLEPSCSSLSVEPGEGPLINSHYVPRATLEVLISWCVPSYSLLKCSLLPSQSVQYRELCTSKHLQETLYILSAGHWNFYFSVFLCFFSMLSIMRVYNFTTRGSVLGSVNLTLCTWQVNNFHSCFVI